MELDQGQGDYLGNSYKSSDQEYIGYGGGWVAQSFEHPALDFSSGCDPKVMRSSPVSEWRLLKILSPSAPSLTHACSLSLSLSLSNEKKRIHWMRIEGGE